MPEDHKQPPQNVKEVGIHIGWSEFIDQTLTLCYNHNMNKLEHLK